MEIQLNETTKADIFAAMFQHIKMFGDNVNIHFMKERMHLQVMDSSRISIYEVHLPSSWFDVYTIHNSDITLGINGSFLYKVLNTRDKTQSVTFMFDSSNSDCLCIEFKSNQPAIFDKYFELPLLEIDSDHMQIPEMEYQAEFSLLSITFSTLIEQLRMIGDTLNIVCSEEKIKLSAQSECNGKMNVDIPIDDLNSFAIEENQEMNISFSLAQMHNICLHHKIAKNVDIYLTTNFPIKIVYSLGQEAKIIFYLAPKIDDNDE